ncbi:cell wall hydrolase [uncultured Sphingomonas sp.]|uniref:cell wall hydrolase n=1 Tax=uncultured Sphingomonas sp. TaxID=158754 RepID=UPI0025DCD801|nr:cell wall hydrolase [uncultured Sphingomonas sp.]
MPFSSRIATFATLTFSVLALVAQSAPGLAAELPAVPAASTAIQLALPAQVPTIAPAAPTVQEATVTPEQVEEQIAYPTLAAAVADQSIRSDADEDLRCLAGAIYFESRGEPLSGQLAVAEVILNRTRSRRFGGSVCDVVTQKGQFSFVRGGRMPAAPSNDDWRTAMAVAKVAIKDAWESDASNALYFNHRRAGHANGVRVASIGNHVFYR